MATLPDFDDLFTAIEREILMRPTAFNPEIVRTDGSDVNIAVAFAAAGCEEASRYGQVAIGETFFGIAAQISDESLDRVAYDRYQERRKQSRAALVTLEFSRTGNDGFTIPARTIVTATDGTTFSTLTDVPFPENDHGPYSVVARAEQTGTRGNVDHDTITTVSGLEDASTTVTNPGPASGGREAETNPQFLARLYRFWLTARRGTRAAIEAGCLEVVEQANVIEHLDSNGSPAGRVQAIIADADGQANQALADEVLLVLEEYRGLGVPVTVYSGTPEYVRVQATGLAFQAGVNTTAVLSDARLRVVARINATLPNQTLRRATILAGLESTPGLIVPDGALIVPAGDLVPSSGGVIRSRIDFILLNE
jgi:uncharacterized phage protein gp47/JayE